MSKVADDSFRDSIGTIDKEGKRAWVYPKKPEGKYYNKRKMVSYLLLIVLFAAPFIKINNNQLFLFNVLERKFSILGFTFWPQDFYIVVIAMIIGIVFVALFTVAFGRIFCGWICPQTIFMEMVFRRIEYWIEGDRGAQIRLNKQPWNKEKVRKKGIKWFLFFIISFLIANVFLAYVIGSDQVLLMIKHGPQKHLSTLIALLIFTGVFYFVFAWFREQVCIIACPYGRLQGVLLDEKSIVVAYDYVRGESTNGRAKFRKNEDRTEKGVGDCIDCFQCVHVCPTGIDIRNGTQLECVNCTACIDACDHIMESVNMPKGLIRYASESEISKKEKFQFTARMKGYSAVLLILIGILTGLLFLRSNVETKILRLPGQLFEHKGENISNVYTYKIANKTARDFDEVTIKLIQPEGKIILVGNKMIKIPKEGMVQGTLFIEIPQKLLQSDKTEVQLEIYNNEELIDQTKTNFLGPRSFN
ncbi:cytochrome c oxidase accessory protein FixG [Paenimyroides aquimaris]|uniref:Cytochrome c oxidase accessory protein FixG n=1 Tax=Paenimyroides marinum TaxID=1159016 RepID=A0A1H6JWT2_9FLAO|nr:cytochrome c oxidase accessory protein CcoG [Paenimyroides aquimaris]SEH66874.1 cytochrome c oxidase accessory protein FixG [Paenimyroides aquimaris]